MNGKCSILWVCANQRDDKENEFLIEIGVKKMIEQNDDVKFREFLKRHSSIPDDILQMQLDDYHRQSKSMKIVIQELIGRQKEDINAEYWAVSCMLGWIDEACHHCIGKEWVDGDWVFSFRCDCCLWS